MPVYNGSKYIHESIKSVLKQTFSNWELLVVNDGSTDETKGIVLSYKDSRIKYFEQKNSGVSSARNYALRRMQGHFFCFLDSDDILPMNSLSSRLKVFSISPEITFVDGKVIYFDKNMKFYNRIYSPRYTGNPHKKLLRISRSCYFGPSWMIRIDKEIKYRFLVGMSHSEDLLFYLSISKHGKYDYTDKPVLFYRDNPDSAMKNYFGLESGYYQLLKSVKNDLFPSTYEYLYLKFRLIKIMLLTHLVNGKDPISAFRSTFKYLFMIR